MFTLEHYANGLFTRGRKQGEEARGVTATMHAGCGVVCSSDQMTAPLLPPSPKTNKPNLECHQQGVQMESQNASSLASVTTLFNI